MSELKEAWLAFMAFLSAYAVTIIVILLIAGAASFVGYEFVYVPQAQTGFSNNVSNLVGEYCSPEYAKHKADLKSNLIAMVEANPDKADRLPTSVKNKVEAVRHNDTDGACN